LEISEFLTSRSQEAIWSPGLEQALEKACYRVKSRRRRVLKRVLEGEKGAKSDPEMAVSKILMSHY
jgi:hypothetical protein